MSLEGKVWRYGDNIDTDVIIPARYLNSFDPKDLAAHCMEDKVCGSRRVREMFSASFDCAEIRDFWMKDVDHWRSLSKPYLLY